MLGLQHAGSSRRKRKENKCKFIVQMTRVQRVPCFSYIMPLHQNYPRNTSWMTFLRHVKWVCSNQTCHPQPLHQSMLLEDQTLFYMSFLLQFVNDSVPMSYVICIYSICSASYCISSFTERPFTKKKCLFDWKLKNVAGVWLHMFNFKSGII